MSQDSLRRFYEAVSHDESLKARLMAIATRHGGQNLSASECDALWENEIAPFAKSEGFDFTLQDVREFQAGRGSKAGKLPDEELDAVVGGSRCMCVIGGGGAKDENHPTCACVGLGQGGDNCWCNFFGDGW
ncbi:MAG: Nif11 family protein [Acidobacteria bacterium]|nr:MAG: Nif11 family protein [Acidobacteriota bacterium]